MDKAKWLYDNSFLLLMSAGTLFSFCWLMRFRERLRLHWAALLVCAVLHTAAGVLSVLVFAIAEAGFDPGAAGNMSLFGGVFLMPAFYWGASKLFRRKTGDVFDICTICMLFTVMCARINCVIAGCCQGSLIPGLSLRWPTREAEILFYIVLLFVLGRRVMAGGTKGRIYPCYMASYGAFRLITEFLRTSQQRAGIFHLSHLWAVITLALGLSIYFELSPEKKKGRR